MADDLRHLTLGRAALLLADGDLRRISFDGVEVLRRVSYPVRDTSWGTWPTDTVEERLETSGARLDYLRRFQGRGGVFQGTFRAEGLADADGLTLILTLELDAETALPTNRAGFTLLHPLAGVSGAALTVTHPDGTVENTRFPPTISPSQPVYSIAGLHHEVAGVTVDLRMEGEVFEMEDQRNWSDASYKTYCRPLSLPWGYPLGGGHPVRQVIHLRVTGTARTGAALASTETGVMPQVLVACEPGLTGADTTMLHHYKGQALQLRVTADTPTAVLAAHAGHGPVALEIVTDPSDDSSTALADLAARVRAAGLDVVRVIALPRSYLASHQPEGPWPKPAPRDLISATRAAFPKLPVGGGMLTNFTEVNRCRPDAATIDFLTYGTTAIVHAADDLSVIETLEALPEIHASAHAIYPGGPIHLGLCSIGMRSNPYGAKLADNPMRERLAMAMDDPRQDTTFAAAFAVGILAAAAAAGVKSLALAMADGPLGAVRDGTPLPLWHVIRHAAALAGDTVRIERAAGLIVLRGSRGGLAANLSHTDATLPAPLHGRLMTAADAAPAKTPARIATLPPLAIAFLTGE